MGETVTITIPAKAEHLLVVRLAASGICSRLGMGIEQMEDTKAAVAEACLVMIHDRQGFERLEITFVYSDSLRVSVDGRNPGVLTAREEDIDADLSLALLEALTEQLTVAPGQVTFLARGDNR